MPPGVHKLSQHVLSAQDSQRGLDARSATGRGAPSHAAQPLPCPPAPTYLSAPLACCAVKGNVKAPRVGAKNGPRAKKADEELRTKQDLLNQLSKRKLHTQNSLSDTHVQLGRRIEHTAG